MKTIKRANQEVYNYGRDVILAITLFTIVRILPVDFVFPGGFALAGTHWIVGLILIAIGGATFVFSKKDKTMMLLFLILYIIDFVFILIVLIVSLIYEFNGTIVLNGAFEFVVRIAAIVYLVISLKAYKKIECEESGNE